MLSNNYKNKALADETNAAKERTARIKEAQNQQEKSRLQLQISNRERELERLVLDLKNKQNTLEQKKRELADANKQVFVLSTQIKQKEGTNSYLKDEVVSHSSQGVATEAKLKEIERQIAVKKREIEKLEQDYRVLTAESQKIIQAKSVTEKTTINHRKDLEKDGQNLLFKKRIIAEIERGLEIINQEITRINRDKQTKEREIDDLKRKRDLIG